MWFRSHPSHTAGHSCLSGVQCLVTLITSCPRVLSCGVFRQEWACVRCIPAFRRFGVGGPRGGGGTNLEKVGREGWGPEGGGPKFRACFSLSRPHFRFFSSLWGTSRVFFFLSLSLRVFSCLFFSLSLSEVLPWNFVELHTTAQEPVRAFEGAGASNTPKYQRRLQGVEKDTRRPRERKKEREREKKREILGGPAEGGVQRRGGLGQGGAAGGPGQWVRRRGGSGGGGEWVRRRGRVRRRGGPAVAFQRSGVFSKVGPRPFSLYRPRLQLLHLVCFPRPRCPACPAPCWHTRRFFSASATLCFAGWRPRLTRATGVSCLTPSDWHHCVETSRLFVPRRVSGHLVQLLSSSGCNSASSPALNTSKAVPRFLRGVHSLWVTTVVCLSSVLCCCTISSTVYI